MKEITGNHWRYGLMAHEYIPPGKTKSEISLELHEIHFEDGKPVSYTSEPIKIGGNNLCEIRQIIKNITDDINRPIYFYGDKWPQIYIPPIEWEMFCDESYYHMWAVRPFGNKNFNSPLLFHVQTKEEAYALRDWFNEGTYLVDKGINKFYSELDPSVTYSNEEVYKIFLREWDSLGDEQEKQLK